MEEFIDIANKNLNCAYEIINKLNIRKIWADSQYTANLVGSIKTKLLMNNLDIDFHVYSKSFSIQDSFQAISKIANNYRIKNISYFNFIEEKDKSLDWHLHYLDKDNRKWRIDIIQLMKDSPYVGKAEAVAEKINSVMNDNIRKTILQLKWEASNEKIEFHGIEIYKAVLEEDINTLSGFLRWQNENKGNNWWDIKIS